MNENFERGCAFIAGLILQLISWGVIFTLLWYPTMDTREELTFVRHWEMVVDASKRFPPYWFGILIFSGIGLFGLYLTARSVLEYLSVFKKH